MNSRAEPLAGGSRIALILAWIANVSVFALFVYFVFGYISSADGLVDQYGRIIGRDFVVFWSTAVLTAQGHLFQIYDPAAFRALLAELFAGDVPKYAWVHPPHMLFFVLPLAKLPYLWALAAWSLLTYGAYTLATRKPSLLFAPATFINFYIGQAGFLLGALYFAALRLLSRHPVLAGICIGFVAIKPHLGILIPVALAAARAWTAFASATLTIGALIALSALVFGWEAWYLWLVHALPHQASQMQGALGGNITVSAFAGARILGLPVWGAWMVQAPLTLLGAMATWWAFSRLRRDVISETSAFAILLLSTMIATPYVFNYDLTLIAPVALHALSRWRRRARDLSDLGELSMWLVIWALPVLVLFLNRDGLPLSSLLLTAALGLTIWRVAQQEPDARSEFRHS